MAKGRSVEIRLDRLRALRDAEMSPKFLADLRAALRDQSNFVVAAAAEIVGERGLAELATDLDDAFRRFLIDPAETDKICRAKIAAADALNKLEYDGEELFRLAIRHVQMEPRWGGSGDTAPPLRAAGAFGLLRIHPRDLMNLLADLLADPEKVARSAAAKALGALASEGSVALLRLKARVGDQEPEVIADCLSAIISAEPKGSLEFVAAFLNSDVDEIAESAALALAESRHPEALEALRDHWPRARGRELEGVLLLAIAITRLPAGIEFLLEVLASDAESAAAGATSALAIHRHNPNVRERVDDAVKKRKLRSLSDAFNKEFGDRT